MKWLFSYAYTENADVTNKEKRFLCYRYEDTLKVCDTQCLWRHPFAFLYNIILMQSTFTFCCGSRSRVKSGRWRTVWRSFQTFCFIMLWVKRRGRQPTDDDCGDKSATSFTWQMLLHVCGWYNVKRQQLHFIGCMYDIPDRYHFTDWKTKLQLCNHDEIKPKSSFNTTYTVWTTKTVIIMCFDALCPYIINAEAALSYHRCRLIIKLPLHASPWTCFSFKTKTHDKTAVDNKN